MRVCSLQNPVSIITCFPLYSLPFSFQILQISSGPTPVEIAYKGVPSEGKVGCWGRNNPSHTHTQTHARTHTHTTHTLFWDLLVVSQNVLVKFPDTMLSVNLENFIINEIQNSINIYFHRNQTFTGDDGF